MYRRFRSFVVVLAVFCAFIGMASATVTVPNVISDHMLIQQKAPVKVWGKADPGEEVVVALGGKQAKTCACPKGCWSVTLPKMKAGGPIEMTISGKSNTIKVSDILVGEVWAASGQSNMQWSVRNSMDADKEIAAANYPQMRLFTVPNTVADQPRDNCDGKWVVCTPETVPDFSAVAYFFGRELHKTLNVPVGMINTSWGGTPAESWTTRETLEANPNFKPIVDRWNELEKNFPAAKKAFDEAMAKWQQDADKAKAEGKPEPEKPKAPQDPMGPWRPAGLYNSMIAPLTPFAIKGAIWYQGESNAGRAEQYRTLFPAMITDWRKMWGIGDFPFYFVQLANFMDQPTEPGPSEWAELREAQSMTLTLKNTGMAVIIDIGEAKDIHPKNKQDVGKRLALNALAKDYGKRVVWSGPEYKSMKAKGGKVTLTFKHADGGLVAKGGEPLKGFEIAGEDKKFVWADATIKGSKVIVSSDKVEKPVAVRYAWANNPICNLFNGSGLPASPFRTDEWPGVTVGKK